MDLVGTVAVAAGTFAGTNVDDLIVLTVLFLSARAAGRPRPWQIWTGQYLGVGALVAISAVAALGLTVVPDRWIGLAGLVPFAMGVRGLVKAIRGGGEDGPVIAGSLTAIVGVTVANGADNISVYTPLFRTIGLGASLVTVAVFAAGIALWCLVARRLGSHRRIIAVVERWGHWLVPVVFMAIGAVIVIESGLLG
ncbi:cadmium resistance protein CadD (predicted permease) [Hamadaea flava]|uniref:Cadmium resistance transporter n=1 Tax=Hamadaea flava TaxID=1742688 RepID=A0ABV8M2V3_9ACTN|nr:cadmium resistance transporter [Hamadaea flava]MCP2328421.1 cadmium resistance protein CadD (predicted permease) [Hamadaea flava]